MTDKLYRNEARRNFKVSPQAALKPYLQLQSIATALKEAQPAAEDAAPHLVDHVDQTARTLWRQMKETFASEFEKTLEQMKWPSKEIALTAELEKEWTAGVEKLLGIQEPCVFMKSFFMPLEIVINISLSLYIASKRWLASCKYVQMHCHTP